MIELDEAKVDHNADSFITAMTGQSLNSFRDKVEPVMKRLELKTVAAGRTCKSHIVQAIVQTDLLTGNEKVAILATMSED